MVAEAPERTLRDKIGGRWSVSWQGYLLLLPISIIFAVTTVPALQETDLPGFGVIVSLVGYAVTGAVLWGASVTVLRHRLSTPAPVVVVAAVGAVAWAARSATIAAALAWADVPSATAPEGRLVFGLALGAVAVPFTAWALDGLADFRTRREVALERLVAEQVALERQSAFVETMRAGLVREVSAGLDGARRDLDEIALSTADLPHDAVEAMQRASRDAVRRVSHETWQEARAASTPSAAEVLRVAAVGKPFRVWSLLMLAPFWMVVLTRIVEWQEALIVVVVTGIYSAVIIVAANRVVPASLSPVASYGIAVLLLGLVGPVAWVLLSQMSAQVDSGAMIAVLATTVVVITIPLAGLVKAFGRVESQGLDALESSISAAEVQRLAMSEQERRARQEIAIALHGTVGANLTAATMRLRRAMDNGDVAAAAEALAESRRLLDVDLHSLLLREHSDVRTALEELADQWFGLVAIAIDIDADLDVAPATAQAVIDVVTEGISNSVGHGGATAIDVTVTRNGNQVSVVIEDDGHPPTQGAPGLGSRMLDEHAPGRWSREARGPQGSRLTIQLDR